MAGRDRDDMTCDLWKVTPTPRDMRKPTHDGWAKIRGEAFHVSGWQKSDGKVFIKLETEDEYNLRRRRRD